MFSVGESINYESKTETKKRATVGSFFIALQPDNLTSKLTNLVNVLDHDLVAVDKHVTDITIHRHTIL